MRDEFAGDEHIAWLEFFDRWYAEQDKRKQAEEHKNVMSKAAKALR